MQMRNEVHAKAPSNLKEAWRLGVKLFFCQQACIS